jgi:hypothetical protein
MSTAQDPRYRTKVYLDTYLTAANMLKDDDATQLSTITQFTDPHVPYERIFYDPKNVDVVFAIDTPESVPKNDWDGTIYGYRETVPISILTVTKQGITGAVARWRCERELRRVVETYPSGSYRSLRRMRDYDQEMGGWILHGVVYELTYERDTT